MGISIEDGLDVAERSAALDVKVPTALAILPRNFSSAASKSELLYDPHASTLRKLWMQAGLQETPIEPVEDVSPRALERQADWIGPTLFFGWLLWSQNPHAIDLAIAVLVEYAERLFVGRADHGRAKFEILVETSGRKKAKRIRYEGDVRGLSELPEIIKHVGRSEEVE